MFNFFKKLVTRSDVSARDHSEPLVDSPQQQAANASFYEYADGSTLEILLPRLCGSRQAASLLMEEIKPKLETGKAVQLNGRLTTVGSEAYCDELLALMTKAHVKKLLVTPTSNEFEQNLLAAGKKHEVAVELVG